MATTKTPIRTVYDNSNAPIGLAEFQTGEVIDITHGGTGGNTVATAKLQLSLTDSNIRSLISVSGGGSYNNTTGVITINSTDLTPYATINHVTNEIANVIDAAPGLLDTLNELAAAINDDANFATTITTSVSNSRNQANAAYDRANVAVTYAGSAFDKANTLVATVAGVSSTSISNAVLLAGLLSVDGVSSNLDSDLLDGQQGSYYLDWTNTTNKPDPLITVTLTGDVSGSASASLIDLASNTITISTTISSNSVELGTDTTGAFVGNITPGSGITTSGTPSEGWSVAVALDNSGVVASTYGGAAKVPVLTVDAFGRITNAANVNVAGVTNFSSSGNTFNISTADGGSFSASIQQNSIILGTDTTGAYVANLVAGTGVTITGLGNEGTTPTIAIGQAVGTTNNVTFNSLTVSNGANITGNVEVTGNINATEYITSPYFYTYSDRNLKSEIQEIHDSLDTLKKLQGVSFVFNSTGEKSFGLIAQDVEEILPEIVHTNPSGIKTIVYDSIIAFLIESIKEQQKQIDELKARL